MRVTGKPCVAAMGVGSWGGTRLTGRVRSPEVASAVSQSLWMGVIPFGAFMIVDVLPYWLHARNADQSLLTRMSLDVIRTLTAYDRTSPAIESATAPSLTEIRLPKSRGSLEPFRRGRRNFDRMVARFTNQSRSQPPPAISSRPDTRITDCPRNLSVDGRSASAYSTDGQLMTAAGGASCLHSADA